MKRATHEQLLNGEVSTVSLINEPIVDFVVDYTVQQGESAVDRARRRWQHAELILGDQHER